MGIVWIKTKVIGPRLWRIMHPIPQMIEKCRQNDAFSVYFDNDFGWVPILAFGAGGKVA